MRWIPAASFILFFAHNAFTETLDRRERLLADRLRSFSKAEVQIRKPQSAYPAYVSEIAMQFERDLANLGPGCASVRQSGGYAVQSLIEMAKDSISAELLKDMLFGDDLVLAYSNVATDGTRCAVRRFRLIFADKTILTVDFR